MDAKTLETGARVRAGPARGVATGAVAGVLGAVAFALCAMVESAAAGQGFWGPIKLLAARGFGWNAFPGSAGVLLLGVVFHLFIGAVLGMAFGALTRKVTSWGASLAAGLAFGVVVWALMTWLVLPTLDAPLSAWARSVPVLWFLDHLVFGLVLGLAPSLRKVPDPLGNP